MKHGEPHRSVLVPRFSEKPAPSHFLVKQTFSWDEHVIRISIPASLQGQRAGHSPLGSVPATRLCPETRAGALLFFALFPLPAARSPLSAALSPVFGMGHAFVRAPGCHPNSLPS